MLRCSSNSASELGGSRHMALPIGLFGLVPVTVPLRRGRALVMHPEKSGGEPPLDGPANRSAAAPAVDIAAALAVPRVVDALDQSPGHSVESRSLAGWQRNPSSRSGRRSLHRTLRWLESARRAGLPSTTSSRSIASGVRLGRERVLAKRDVSGHLGWTSGDRIRGPVWGRNSPRASGALAVVGRRSRCQRRRAAPPRRRSPTGCPANLR